MDAGSYRFFFNSVRPTTRNVRIYDDIDRGKTL